MASVRDSVAKALTAVFFLGVIYPAWGATVLKRINEFVLLDVSPSELVTQGEDVCFEEKGRPFLYGKVAKIAGRKVAIRINPEDDKKALKVGQFFSLRSVSRSLSAVSAVLSSARSEARADRAQEKRMNLSVGGNGGLNYIYPMAHFEVLLEERFTIGAMPLFFLQRGSLSQVTGFGAFATLSYYFTKQYEGFGAVIGPGVYSLTLVYDTSIEEARLLAAMGQLQYRYRFPDSDWFIGASAGAQYIIANTTQISLSFQGLLPMLSAYASCNF